MVDYDQLIKMKWTGKNKQYYLDKGYVIPNFREEFIVPLKDIHPSSNCDIVAYCDNCGAEMKIRRKRYEQVLEKYGNVVCYHCTQSRSLDERQKSHYKLCLEFCEKHGYIPVSKQDDILSRDSIFVYICPEHGEQHVKVTSILQGKICYRCSRQVALSKKWSHDKEERLDTLYNKVKNMCETNGYILLSQKDEIVDGWDSYIRYSCPKHGEHSISINNLLSNHRKCQQCAYESARSRWQLSHDDILSRVAECGGVLLNPDEYINNSTKNLRITCPRCGNEFVTSLQSFVQYGGQLCPDCYRKESIGEFKVRKFLEGHGIEFDPEHRFKGCEDERPLPFDFYLPKKNTVIEFDGEQHFKDDHFFNYSLEKQRLHDSIKNAYCQSNNIHIIRIPYWAIGQINDILTKELL